MWPFFTKRKIFVDPIETVYEKRDLQEEARIISAVRQSFDEQRKEMYHRSLRGHEITCEDKDCSGCFTREPDKIVSPPYLVDMRAPMRLHRPEPENYESMELSNIVNEMNYEQEDTSQTKDKIKKTRIHLQKNKPGHKKNKLG